MVFKAPEKKIKKSIRSLLWSGKIKIQLVSSRLLFVISET